jgi:hypothetical protein
MLTVVNPMEWYGAFSEYSYLEILPLPLCTMICQVKCQCHNIQDLIYDVNLEIIFLIPFDLSFTILNSLTLLMPASLHANG